jgi:dethiobiotin synthetase
MLACTVDQILSTPPPLMNLFITGTDTSVGKTFASALLTRALRQAGLGTIALKPLCSGERSDVEILRAASDHILTLDETNPIWLQAPAAPLVAAQLEHRTLSLDPLQHWFARLSEKHPSLLVEGAGGWLVPITPTETIADLAARLSLPVVVVVANRLGCLNHTLLTLESIRARGLQCPGIVLNTLSSTDDIATRTNRELLERHTPILLEIHPSQKDIPPTHLAHFLHGCIIANPAPK